MRRNRKAPLVLVTGTGTGIGKTHASVALVHCWGGLLRASGVLEPRVAGLKPIESGLAEGVGLDGATLEHASTFHVKRFPAPYLLARAVSPHLAAEHEGKNIERAVICSYVGAVRAEADAVVVELAGGLFSPLAHGLTNADVAKALAPDLLILVAPDRLGVLHDVGAATRAAKAEGLLLDAILLIAAPEPDASSGTNARELRTVTDVPVAATIAREPVQLTAARAELAALLRPWV